MAALGEVLGGEKFYLPCHHLRLLQNPALISGEKRGRQRDLLRLRFKGAEGGLALDGQLAFLRDGWYVVRRSNVWDMCTFEDVAALQSNHLRWLLLGRRLLILT